jgi:ribosomal protein L40E
MKCSTHPDVDAVGVCVSCGRAVCSKCRTMVGGKTYCPACAAGASEPVVRQQTAKPVAGGILGIIAGVLGLFLGFLLIVGASATDYPWETADWTLVGLGIAEVVFGIVAIIGSSHAFGRKYFARSVIGGISAVLAIWPLGIPALILIAMSRHEFQAASINPICVTCGKENPPSAKFCMNCSRELRGPRL